MTKEFQKIYLPADLMQESNTALFSDKWNEVKRHQTIFLLERPLILKVLTEKYFGPQKLINDFTNEWWEAEQWLRSMNKGQQIEELADMSLLLLTFDSLSHDISFQSQRNTLRLGLTGTVASYCDEIGLKIDDLIPTTKRKIKTNKLRNPKEAYMLIQNEDMSASRKRMDQNWSKLKENRGNIGRIFKNKNWWKSKLYIDDRGNVVEKE